VPLSQTKQVMNVKTRIAVNEDLDNNTVRRVRELDGWRAISVLFVIFHHILGYQHHSFVSQFPVLDHGIEYLGQLGVKIFFVISGFVICRLLISEELRNKAVSLKAFYYRRIFRILPPFYLYLITLSLLLRSKLIRESWWAIVSSGLFLFDIGRITPHSWFVGHTWSLALEEQFYLIFPTMFVLIPKAWRGRAFGATFVLLVTWNLSMVHTGWHAVISTDSRAGFACICCGVLMAIYERSVRAVAGGVPGFLVMLAGLILLVHPVGVRNGTAAVYESLFVPPAIGLVLMFSLGRGAWLRAFLCSKSVQAVGLTSYGIYLWQQLFTCPQFYLAGGMPQPYFSGTGRIIPSLVPLLCVIVPLSYVFVEKPAMRYGRFLSRRAIRRVIRDPLGVEPAEGQIGPPQGLVNESDA